VLEGKPFGRGHSAGARHRVGAGRGRNARAYGSVTLPARQCGGEDRPALDLSRPHRVFLEEGGKA
jgi:hypothetical protein